MLRRTLKNTASSIISRLYNSGGAKELWIIWFKFCCNAKQCQLAFWTHSCDTESMQCYCQSEHDLNPDSSTHCKFNKTCANRSNIKKMLKTFSPIWHLQHLLSHQKKLIFQQHLWKADFFNQKKKMATSLSLSYSSLFSMPWKHSCHLCYLQHIYLISFSVFATFLLNGARMLLNWKVAVAHKVTVLYSQSSFNQLGWFQFRDFSRIKKLMKE